MRQDSGQSVHLRDPKAEVASKALSHGQDREQTASSHAWKTVGMKQDRKTEKIKGYGKREEPLVPEYQSHSLPESQERQAS